MRKGIHHDNGGVQRDRVLGERDGEFSVLVEVPDAFQVLDAAEHDNVLLHGRELVAVLGGDHNDVGNVNLGPEHGRGISFRFDSRSGVFNTKNVAGGRFFKKWGWGKLKPLEAL